MTLPGPGAASAAALEFGEHFFGGAVEVDADADAGGQLDLDIFERADGTDGDLRCGIVVAHEDAAHEHGRFDLQLALQALVVAREADEVDFSGGVFERGLRVEFLIALAFLHAQAKDHAGDLNFVGGVGLLAPGALGRLAFEGFGGGDDAGEIAELLGVFVERMAGDEEAEDLFFIGEADAFFPVGDVGQIVGCCGRGRALR